MHSLPGAGQMVLQCVGRYSTITETVHQQHPPPPPASTPLGQLTVYQTVLSGRVKPDATSD